MVMETRSSMRGTTDINTTESLIRASFISSLHNQANDPPPQLQTRLLQLHSQPEITTPEATERGPRYGAYSKLRESRLRMRFSIPEDDPIIPSSDKSPIIPTAAAATTLPKMTESLTPSPVKKSVRFQEERLPKRIGLGGMKGGNSCVAQSVPDLSAVLRKENRRPKVNRIETPVRSGSKVFGGSGVKLGSKSVNSGEKRGTGGGGGGGGGGSIGRIGMVRKSYASVEELKGLSMVAAVAIAGESKRGRMVGRNSVLGLRQCY